MGFLPGKASHLISLTFLSSAWAGVRQILGQRKCVAPLFTKPELIRPQYLNTHREQDLHCLQQHCRRENWRLTKPSYWWLTWCFGSQSHFSNSTHRELPGYCDILHILPQTHRHPRNTKIIMLEAAFTWLFFVCFQILKVTWPKIKVGAAFLIIFMMVHNLYLHLPTEEEKPVDIRKATLDPDICHLDCSNKVS